MATSYTGLLGLALPLTGELAGTWGDTVNNFITQYAESAIAGTQTINGSQTAVTLSITNGTTLVQVGAGATGSAQYKAISCTGNPASTLTITVPSSSREYLVFNATTTNQSVVVKGAATTGATIPAGVRAVVAWNGSDYVIVSSTDIGTLLTGVLSVPRGGTGFGVYAQGDILFANTTNTLAKLTVGAANRVLTSSGTAPQWSDSISLATITATTQFVGPGTGLTGTANALSIGGNAATATSATTAGSANTATQATNATNVNGGTVSATTGTFTGTVTAPNFSGTISDATNAQFAVTQPLNDNSTRIATTAYVVGMAFQAALPVQTGNAGKYVTTDGTTASWAAIPKPEVNNAKAFYFSSF